VWINIFPGSSADQKSLPKTRMGFRGKGLAGVVDRQTSSRRTGCFFELQLTE